MRFCRSCFIHVRCNTKIAELRISIQSQKYILRLDIAMQEPSFVTQVQAAKCPPHPVHGQSWLYS